MDDKKKSIFPFEVKDSLLLDQNKELLTQLRAARGPAQIAVFQSQVDAINKMKLESYRKEASGR
jgi:hypothetical protein